MAFLFFPFSDLITFSALEKEGGQRSSCSSSHCPSTLDIPLSIPSDTAQAAEHARQGPPVCARMLTQVNGFMTMSVAFISYIPRKT